MRPLRYSINVTLDGCCTTRRGSPGRGVDALLDRRDGARRCAAVRPGDLRDDGVRVAAAGDGRLAGLDG